MLDVNTLKNEVFNKTGQRISEDDPLFIAVVLNETILHTLLNQHMKAITEQQEKLTSLYQALENKQNTLVKQTDDIIEKTIGHATEAAKIDICTSARETAVNIVKETLALHVRPGLKPIEEATRKLERCSHEASELIQKASPSSDIKLWERCLSIFLSSLAGSLLTLLVLGVLLKTGRLPLYQPVLPAEEIAKELSKELNKPKGIPKKYQPKK